MISEIEEEDIISDIYEEKEFKPSLDHEFYKTKSYLQKPSVFTGDNLYDHLSDVLNKIISERPENVIDFFEDYSRKIKEMRYRDATDHLKDIFSPPESITQAVVLNELLTPQNGDNVEEEEEEDEQDEFATNVMEHAFYLEQMGVGLPRTEMFILGQSLKTLARQEPLKTLRFWGKIYGLESDYYVAEGQLNDEEIARLEGLIEEEEENVPAEKQAEVEDTEMMEEETRPKIPRPKPPIPVLAKPVYPVIPAEKFASGVNKRIYFVSHQPGVKPWIKLPDVTPEQIQICRQIVKYFTGNLEQPFETYPPFPGVEKHYLRAQIARITAGTEVAPTGMFSFTEDNEEEEDIVDEDESIMRTEIYRNRNYEPVSIKDLNDGTFSFWVHTSMYILPQGRCIWWNPKGESEEQIEEELEEEEEVEAETGPPLLHPLSEDASLESITPWTIRLSSLLQPNRSFASIRSNLWPGAYNYTVDKKVGFIYIGPGHKYFAYNYSPPPLPPIMEEYPLGPEIMEMVDPSGVEEEAWRLAHEQHKLAEEEEVWEEQDDDDD